MNFLLEQGANIEAWADNGDRPLHAAGTFGTVETVLALLDQGAINDKFDKDGKYPLDLARLRGADDVAAVLATRGHGLGPGWSVVE